MLDSGIFRELSNGLQVQRPRDPAAVEKQVLLAAEILGREAFYAWGSGKNHTGGGTIHLANAMLAAYGNAVVAADPVVETAEAWYFTHHFVDMETQTSRPRQFMQSKREDVGMRTDPLRANQIRFNKGQSKAILNCILQAAKKGVSAKMEAFIKAKDIAAAQTYTLNQLKGVGVDEAAVLLKAGRDKVADLNLDDLVMLAADYKAIENGDAHASELFELKDTKASGAAADLKSKLKRQVEQTTKAEPPKAEQAMKAEIKSTDVIVKPGTMQFTYYTTDQGGEYLTHVDGDKHSCNCDSPPGHCVHVVAVEAYIKG